MRVVHLFVEDRPHDAFIGPSPQLFAKSESTGADGKHGDRASVGETKAQSAFTSSGACPREKGLSHALVGGPDDGGALEKTRTAAGTSLTSREDQDTDREN